MGACEFINQTHSYVYNGHNYTHTTLDYAKWASYQTYKSTNVGSLPVAFFITQWGIEGGWGGDNWSIYDNPAEQGASCGVGTTCGSQPAGFPIFCSIRDGVMSYTNLIIHGYPFVQWAYGSTNIVAAFQAIGQGFSPSWAGQVNYCGWTGVPNGNPQFREWDATKYDDGNGPGSMLIDTYNANTCLQSLNYIQTTDPLLEGFTNVY